MPVILITRIANSFTGGCHTIKVARMPVVCLKRAGGQSQYNALLAAQMHSESDRFSELDRWTAELLTGNIVRRDAKLAHLAGTPPAGVKRCQPCESS